MASSLPRRRGAAVLAGLLLLLALAPTFRSPSAEPRSVSGIYPHLAMFGDDGECGTGAVVPWADRLWVVTYAPHRPEGSPEKLYEITPALAQIVRPESIGGTPANRMLHRESQQLFIGPYAIDARGQVRAIPYRQMFGRPTGTARHLTDPANKVVFATMEEGIYEVDVHTLAVTEWWRDEHLHPTSGRTNRPADPGRFADLPGYHGKGFYSGQGVLVYANNGEHGAEAQRRPDVPSGVLAEWDGKADAWTLIRRQQFTEVTGPGGIEGNPHPATDPVWSTGWDHRSLILMVRDRGRWHAYRLPKASHTYDGAHGWNTEWPRIRDIGEDDLLMTMHGTFWRFPRGFSSEASAGLAPRSTYLKVVGDFCRWGDRVVLGCDDTAKSEFLNRHPLKGNLAPPGKSQSNLWFVRPSQLDDWGPALGRGGVWVRDDVAAGVPSEPFLFSGFTHRSLVLTHDDPSPATFTLEVDRRGQGAWTRLRDLTVPGRGQVWTAFPRRESGAWVRLVPHRAVPRVTAFFHYRADDPRGTRARGLFDGLARARDTAAIGGLLHARGGDHRSLRCLARDAEGEIGSYDLDGDLRLRRVDDPAGAAWTATAVAIPPSPLVVDGGSVLYVDDRGRRWRLPVGEAAFDQPGPFGAERLCREVCTERNLLHVRGTFFELPAENAGGFIKLRPIATHDRRIHDFASYRGLLVLSGLDPGARGRHIVRSDDGRAALWVGAVDDLWALGKPRGTLAAWRDSPVQAGVPSDACLATGYDRKRLVLRNSGEVHVEFRVEADVLGDGTWVDFTRLEVGPGTTTDYAFPDAFGAYWLRLVAERDTTASATLIYE